MNELVLENNEIRIKSVELVDIINQFRELEEGKSKLLHKDLMKKIRKVLDVVQNQQNFNESNYIDKKGERRPCYKINKNGIKYLIDTTKSSDRIPLQKVYEQLGGNHSGIICIDRFETTFFNKLHDVLKPLDIVMLTQKTVLDYRLDGYIPKFNIAIEYDESQHFIEPQKSQDIIRQKEIEKALKCNFVRCDYRNTDACNIGLVLNEIINRKEVI